MLLLLLHLPRKAFAASSACLLELVEAAQSPEACESAKVLSTLLRAFVTDGTVRPADAIAAMGPEVAQLRAALLEAAAGAEPRLPEAYAYVTVPPEAPGPEQARAAASGAHASQQLTGAIAPAPANSRTDNAATRAPEPKIEHNLFAVRPGYVDPLLKHRALPPPPKPLARPGMQGGRASEGATAAFSAARTPAPAPSSAKQAAAAAAVKAAAARKAANAAAAPKKRSIMMADDDDALAQVSQREAAASAAKQKKR